MFYRDAMDTRYYQQDHAAVATATASDFLKIFSFAFMVVLGLVQLKFQNEEQKNGPFKTHPKTSYVAVISSLMYCFLLGMLQRFCSHHIYRTWVPVIARATLFFALLSLLSVASLLFPDSARVAFYFLCILLSVGDWPYSLLFQKIKNWWLNNPPDRRLRLPV
nr:hypothetical protein A4A49_63750 [Ipomoea trifida]